MAEFIKLDPPPTLCIGYGTGGCCHDRHFDPSEVMPQATVETLCGEKTLRKTTDRKRVNCKECLELLHS